LPLLWHQSSVFFFSFFFFEIGDSTSRSSRHRTSEDFPGEWQKAMEGHAYPWLEYPFQIFFSFFLYWFNFPFFFLFCF
jgi:hypothetical protein